MYNTNVYDFVYLEYNRNSLKPVKTGLIYIMKRGEFQNEANISTKEAYSQKSSWL